jgi:hypothetical protein
MPQVSSLFSIYWIGFDLCDSGEGSYLFTYLVKLGGIQFTRP